jgi:hypothetical protein
MPATVAGGTGKRSTNVTAASSTFRQDDYTGPVPAQRRPASTSRAWAAVGVAAAVSGIVGIGASMGVDAAYNEEVAGNAPAMVDRLADQVPQLVVFHVATMIATLLLLVFAAGLRRRLEAQAPAGSLLPGVAASGLGLVSVAGLIGTGLDTEFIFSVGEPDNKLVPEVGVLFAHWVGTMPWIWAGAGVTALAVAVAALRHAAAPRWLGWFSAVLGVITVAFGVSPLQYMAGMTGPLWLLVASLGFFLGDRSSRR